MPKKIIENAPVSPLYQLIFIAFSAFIITTTLFYTANRIYIIDEQPNIERITPKTFKKFGDFPSIITTGLHINRFEIFDVVKNQFLFDGILWFKFISESISLKTLELFSFNRGEIIKKDQPETLLEDEYVIVRYNIKVKFSSNINYKYFPIDNHRIYVSLTHDFMTLKEVQFYGSEQLFTIEPSALESGWKIIDKHVITGYDYVQFDDNVNNNSSNLSQREKTYPIIIFSFDIKRSGMRHLITVLLPLLLIFYISFFSLSISDGNLRIGVMAMTAIIGYRFVIENMSPNTSYFMISDYIFFLFLIAELMIFLLIIIKLYTNKLSTAKTKFFIACIHLIVIGINSYILLRI